MSDLRTRIAAVVYERDGFTVPWVEAAEFLKRDYLATADAVIDSLNLREMGRQPSLISGMYPQVTIVGSYIEVER